jgi:hypothetical protein
MVPPKPAFTVRPRGGGPQQKTTSKMGQVKALDSLDWELLDAAGQTVGYLAGEKVAQTLARSAQLHRLLVEVGAYHHLKARFDNGYLEIPVEMLRELEKLMAP